MNISEATDALRPGEKYLFLTNELLRKGLTEEQLGKPETDGIVVNYRGIDIISIETGNNTYGWHAGGYLEERTLRAMVEQIDKRMKVSMKDYARAEVNPPESTGEEEDEEEGQTEGQTEGETEEDKKDAQ